MRILKTLAVLATGTALAACNAMTAGPAGVGAESHLFGVANDQNFNAMLAYGDPAGRIRALNDAFRAAAQDTVTFEFNSAALDAEARRALKGQAKWLKETPHARMAVVGHTDLVGSEGYNDRLGMRRARAVVAYLVSQGISGNRLDAVESRGEAEPVVATEERERRNRRTVTAVAGFDRHFVGHGMDARIGERLYGGYVGGGGN
jgi:outer membrane protein OmpA-like peptidoglycan-associated protein